MYQQDKFITNHCMMEFDSLVGKILVSQSICIGSDSSPHFPHLILDQKERTNGLNADQLDYSAQKFFFCWRHLCNHGTEKFIYILLLPQHSMPQNIPQEQLHQLYVLEFPISISHKMKNLTKLQLGTCFFVTLRTAYCIV